MVGLFDSGNGGLNTVRYIKKISDTVDLVYLIDRANAPYGIKTEKELTKITEKNIQELLDMGAEHVLIACCTASTVHRKLGEKYKIKSIPIIDAVAKEARKATRIGRIGVIATNRTVKSHAFSCALRGFSVTELATPDLVTLIDKGLSDKCADGNTERMLEDVLRPIFDQKIDTLILGCTHFPALINTISSIADRHGVISVIDSARIGAELLVNIYNGV